MPRHSISGQKSSPTRLGGYSTKEVAELVGFTPPQVRHFVRRGLVYPDRGPRRQYRFRFQDIVLLRTAKGLIDSGLGSRKVYKALVKLKEELNSVDSLASVRIFVDGSNVVVSSDYRIWDVASGQGRFNFEVRKLADNVAALANGRARASANTKGLSSDDWYTLAIELEDVDAPRAPACYERAVEIDPKNADAHVNLGRLYQLDGKLKQAKRHYSLAMSVAGGHQLAHYNMATLFDELDEFEQAAEHYRRAPDIPNAHYNLARICRLLGDEISAMRHMRRFQETVEDVSPPAVDDR